MSAPESQTAAIPAPSIPSTQSHERAKVAVGTVRLYVAFSDRPDDTGCGKELGYRLIAHCCRCVPVPAPENV